MPDESDHHLAVALVLIFVFTLLLTGSTIHASVATLAALGSRWVLGVLIDRITKEPRHG